MEDIILSEEEYRKAIVRFLEICDSDIDTTEYLEAQKLSKLMEAYEKVSCYERRQLN